ncbi:MAG: DNA translocase FtsK [Chloroflexota bacterium]|nr:DNA translocase FtsK [Chloroflexota bacterium]MDE3193687.1 DNA translocase FtsK [Chloroflexota bacterium]
MPASARGEREIRGEVGAIAIVLLAALSLVALVTDQGTILHWWREVLVGALGAGSALVPPALVLGAAAVWWPALRARLVMPVIGAALVAVALLAIAEISFADPATTGFGGGLGRLVGRALEALFGSVGAVVALLAVFVVGIVIAAERGIAELVAPVAARRPTLALRPGMTLPSGTSSPPRRSARANGVEADVDADEEDVEELEAAPLRINIPEDKPKRTAAEEKARAAALAAHAAAEATAPMPVGSPRVVGTPSIAGLPSAAVAAEGVLHADPPQTPWTLPPVELLEEGAAARSGKDEVLRNTRVIEETLAHFSIAAKVVEVSVGPVVTRYELKPAAGVKLSRIEALSDDLALALAARSLRIEAPIPGKSVVGIEIPNLAIGLVSLKDVAESAAFRDANSKLTVALGRDVAGSPIVADLARLPHLLIAGQTGSGKSVSINAIITSLLMNATPDDVRLILCDPKRVELASFNEVPHLVVPVVTDHDKILHALYWAVGEMDRRYRLFARATARNIDKYNEMRTGVDRVPYIVLVVDELADLMISAPIQVEKAITRIAQLARATGIHLVVATQRPSVDVITGLIKANIPARIAFATASAVDSRTILDMTGAEKLLGRGDMLVLPPDAPKPARAQGVFVSDVEMERVTRHWKAQRAPRYDLAILEAQEASRMRDDDADEMDDDRYEEAVEIVQRAGQASVSMLQRKMTVGFARAGRLIDLMERRGVIGPAQGPGKMREVYAGRHAE